MRKGKFPRGIYFGRVHRWSEKELEAYEAEMQKRDKFVDIISDNVSKKDARIKARAGEMYELINFLAGKEAPSTSASRFLAFKDMARELLKYINGKEDDDE